MSKRILSVSYDEPLLRTRELLLRGQGYTVSSALGFTDAVEHCKGGNFDLFILGHSIPDKDKRQLISVFHGQCKSPVLALRRHGEDAPDNADHHAYPDDIEGLLNTVNKILNDNERRRARGRA
jgi:DNA-binding response OmpR family regulator